MLCHWRYVLDNLFGEVQAVCCLGATHIPERGDENGKTYTADADDAAYATFQLEGGVIAQINSSWCDAGAARRPASRFQVDGTHGSAVAGLQRCLTQPRVNTPRPVWNPDMPQPIKFFDDWEEVPGQRRLRQRLQDRSGRCSSATSATARRGRWDLLEGAKGVQLAELGLKSWTERRWIDVPPLKV